MERPAVLAHAERAIRALARAGWLPKTELRQRIVRLGRAPLTRPPIPQLSDLPDRLACLDQRHRAEYVRPGVPTDHQRLRRLPFDLVAAGVLARRGSAPCAGLPGAGADRRSLSAPRGEADAAGTQDGGSAVPDLVLRRSRTSTRKQQTGRS